MQDERSVKTVREADTIRAANMIASNRLEAKIIRRRPVGEIDCVDVEWSNGQEIIDYHDIPTTTISHEELEHVDIHGNKSIRLKRVSNITTERKACGSRKIIKDQINVPCGTPDSIVMQIIEEKRPRLMEQLGLS